MCTDYPHTLVYQSPKNTKQPKNALVDWLNYQRSLGQLNLRCLTFMPIWLACKCLWHILPYVDIIHSTPFSQHNETCKVNKFRMKKKFWIFHWSHHEIPNTHTAAVDEDNWFVPEVICFHIPVLFTSFEIFILWILWEGSWIAAKGILIISPLAVGICKCASVFTACIVPWFSSRSMSNSSWNDNDYLEPKWTCFISYSNIEKKIRCHRKICSSKVIRNAHILLHFSSSSYLPSFSNGNQASYHPDNASLSPRRTFP